MQEPVTPPDRQPGLIRFLKEARDIGETTLLGMLGFVHEHSDASFVVLTFAAGSLAVLGLLDPSVNHFVNNLFGFANTPALQPHSAAQSTPAVYHPSTTHMPTPTAPPPNNPWPFPTPSAHNPPPVKLPGNWPQPPPTSPEPLSTPVHAGPATPPASPPAGGGLPDTLYKVVALGKSYLLEVEVLAGVVGAVAAVGAVARNRHQK